MLSLDTIQNLDLYRRQEGSYAADPDLYEFLREKTANILVAASAVGKSATKTLIEQADPSFGNTGTRTSRPRRADDTDEYEFDEHSDTGLREPFEIIANHQAVQYTVHPTLGYLYLSEPRHYTLPNALLDMQSQSVGQLQRAPFKHVRTVHLVSEPEPWLDRFNTRFPNGNPERRQRLLESIASHRWTLAQSEAGNWLVETVDGQPEATAQTVHEIFTTGRQHGNSRGRELAAAQITAARALLAAH